MGFLLSSGQRRLGAWRAILALVGLCALIGAKPAFAAHRDCTAAERRAANRQLWLNERDRDLSIATHLPWGRPSLGPEGSRERILTQRDYVIHYDGDLRVPLFTAERVEAARLGRAHRTDCFRQDERVPAQEASRPSDYSEPIFDQGHLAAFANQDRSIIAGNNSFVMTNMVPQTCQFNRGIWQILEGITRLWATRQRVLYVISGSIFDRDMDGRRDDDSRAARMRANNGTRHVAIPTAFYKIIAYRAPDGSLETLSILLPHNQENPNRQAAFDYLSRHITTVADIERRTGLDFFSQSPPLREANNLWPFDREAAPNSLCHSPPRTDFDPIWTD